MAKISVAIQCAILIIAFLAIWILVFALVSARHVREIDYIVPPGAQNATDLGNNWYTFELEENKFLLNYQSGEMEKIE